MNPEIAKQRVSSLSDKEIAKISEARANPKAVKRDDPTPEGYTPIMEKFDQLIDRIGILELSVTSMFASKQDRQKMKFEPVPRPKTEFDKMLDDLVFLHDRNDAQDILGKVGF